MTKNQSSLPFISSLAKTLAECAFAQHLASEAPHLYTKQGYIQQKSLVLEEKMKQAICEKNRQINEAFLFLQEKLSSLSIEEYMQITSEMRRAHRILVGDMDRTQALQEPLQKILSFSDSTLLWMYRIGYAFFQEGQAEKACSICTLLTTLNPLIADYWLALAFTYKELQKTTQALLAFEMHSLLDPLAVVSFYQMAEIHLSHKQIEEAKICLLALEKQTEGESEDQKTALAAYHDIRKKIEQQVA